MVGIPRVYREVYAGYERCTLGGIYPGVYARVPTLLYMPGYTPLGTPLLLTVRHGQRTGRHTAAGERALGSS